MATLMPRTATAVVLWTAVTVLLIPPVVFLLVGMQGGLSAGAASGALLEQYAARRTNLAVVSALGLFPVLLLAAFLGVRRALKRSSRKSMLYALVGALPIVLVTLWVNIEYWPTFLPERQYAGFPHGLELIIGPGAFAPVGMLLTLLVAWVTTRASPEATAER